MPVPSSSINSHSDIAADVTHPGLKDSIPLDGCIQNYDSGYHIIFTNVKTIQQSHRQMRVGRRPRDGAVNISWLAFRPGDRLAGYQYQSAANFAVTDLFKDFVYLR